jgi:hypothetical protein
MFDSRWAFFASLACYAGAVGSIQGCSLAPFLPYPVAMDDIPWGLPKQLSLESCPNIDGVYKAVPIGQKFVDPHITQILGDPKGKSNTVWHSGYDRAKSMALDDRIGIDAERLASITVENNLFTSTQFNMSGKRFVTLTIRLDPNIDPKDHEIGREWRVGCQNGSYIVRTVSSYGSNEGSGKSREWRERLVRKLPNGDLQMHIKGFRQAQRGEPMMTVNYTLIFPEYRAITKD